MTSDGSLSLDTVMDGAGAIGPIGYAGRRISRNTVAMFIAAMVAWTLSSLDQSLFSYALPGILTEFGRGPATAGTIMSVSFLVGAAMVVAAGMAADRFGWKPVLIGLLALSAVFVAALGLVTSIAALTVVRALGFGLGAGLAPVANAVVMTTVGPRWRGMAMGLLQCGHPLGWLIASLAAAPLLGAYGWRATCFVAVVIPPVALVLWLMLRGVPGRLVAAEAGGVTPSGGFRELMGPDYRRWFAASFATFFLFGGAFAGSAFFFPIFFATVRGYSASEAALVVGLSNGVAVIGYLSAAALGEYVTSRRNVFCLWCLLGALALLSLLWLSHGRTTDLLFFALMAMFFYGAMAVLAAVASEIFPPHLRATAFGACGSAPLSLGFVLFPLIVPLCVARIGWTWSLTVVVAPAIVGAALFALLLPSLRPVRA